MKVEKMRITERPADKGPCGVFNLKEETEPAPVPRTGSMAAKMSLCLLVLAAALVVELSGLGEPADVQEPEEEALGALHYVESGGEKTASVMAQEQKWQAPVVSGEITLLKENSLVGFTALTREVLCCAPGEVLLVGEDEELGPYVRVKLVGDKETIYYGFEDIAVWTGVQVAAGQRLGSIQRGGTLYLAVSYRGSPEDPREYVHMDIGDPA